MSGHISRWFVNCADWRRMVGATAGLLGCYAVSQHNFALFHAMVELPALGIACAVCLVCEDVPLIEKPFTAHTLLSTVRQILDAQTSCQLTTHTC